MNSITLSPIKSAVPALSPQHGEHCVRAVLKRQLYLVPLVPISRVPSRTLEEQLYSTLLQTYDQSESTNQTRTCVPPQIGDDGVDSSQSPTKNSETLLYGCIHLRTKP